MTPGQAAYEGFVAFQGALDNGLEYETWDEKDETGDERVMGRADWEAAGWAAVSEMERAVRAEYERDPQADDQYRAGLAFALELLANDDRA